MTPSAGYQAAEYAVWTRVGGPTDRLDLLSARFRCHRYAPHTHEEYALGVCVDGVESIRYRGATHYAGPGGVVVLEPGEAHTGAPALDSGFAYRSIYPPARVLADGQARQPHFRDAVIGDPELAQAFLSAHVALTRGDHLEGEVRPGRAPGLACPGIRVAPPGWHARGSRSRPRAGTERRNSAKGAVR